MTSKQISRRIAAVKTADAINAIEGVPVSNYARMLSRSWARGELSGEQMKAALLDAVCDEPVLYDESALEVTTPGEVQQEKYKKYQTEKYVPQPHYQRED